MALFASLVPRLERFQLLLRLLALAGSYALVAWLGLSLATVHASVSPVWPASGLAVAALCMGGRRYWPAVALGAFGANVTGGASLALAGAFAVGNTAEAWVAAWIVGWCLRRVRRREDAAEAMGLAAASALAPVIAAGVGVVAIRLESGSAGAAALRLASVWWAGDALGILTVAPALLVLSRARAGLSRWTLPDCARLAGLTVAIALACGLTFFTVSGSSMLFVVLPLLLMALAWFGTPGVRWTALAIAAAAFASATAGLGPFGREAAEGQVFWLQLFLTVVSVLALLMPLFRAATALFWPGAVLLAGWTLSGWMLVSLDAQRLKADAASFTQITRNAEEGIQQRMVTYIDGLRAGVSFLAASEHATRAEWRNFAEALEIGKRYPGIHGIGVIFPVARERREAFVRGERLDGAPDFAIHDEAGREPTGAPDHFVITYIEPLATNRPAVGLDTGAEEKRRRAAEESRDTGEPRMTERIALVQDNLKRPGFLLFLPAYRPGPQPATVAARREQLAAWVYAPFIMEDFLRGVLGARQGKAQLHFYEGAVPEAGCLLFASAGSLPAPTAFERVSQLELAGRTFTLGWVRGPEFVPTSPSPMAWAAGGVWLISVLLAALVASVQNTGRRARELAEERTAELAVAQRRLESIFRTAADGIVLHNREGDVQACNPAAERILGLPGDEMRRLVTPGSGWQLLHEDGTPCAREDALVERTLRDGALQAVTYGVRRPDGTLVWVLANTALLPDAAGAVQGVVVSISDVTAYKQADNRAKLQTQRLTLATAVSAIGVWDWDLRNDLAVWDERMHEIYGISPRPDGMMTRDVWRQAVLPEDLAEQEKIINDTLRRRGRSQREYRIRRQSDGAIRYIQTAEVTVTDEAGRPVRMIGVNRDVTALKTAQAALAESERRMRLAADAAGIAVWEWDLRTNAMAWDARMFALYGVSPLTSGKVAYDTWAHCVLPADLAGQEARLRQTVATNGKDEREFRIVRANDGEHRVIHSAEAVIPGPEGKAARVVGVNLDVTEYRRATDALRHSQQMFQRLFDHSPDGILVLDRRGCVERANARAAELFGHPVEELVGKSVEGLVPARDRGHNVAQATAYFAAQQWEVGAAGMELTGLRQDGREFPIEVLLSPIEGETGRQTLAVVRDITLRKRAEQAVADSEERFRTAFEFAGIGMAIATLEGRFLKVNQALCDILGYSREELLARDFQSITHPDDLERDLRESRELVEGKVGSYRIEKRYLHRQGHIVWVRLTAVIVRDAHGAALQGVAQIEDITERKKFEQALRESEARTRLFAEHTPASVAMFDRELRYLVVSQRWLRDYALEGREVIGRRLYDEMPGVAKKWRQVHERALAGMAQTSEGDLFERANGRRQWMRWEVWPWHEASGAVGGILVLTEDITARKELEHSLAKARDEALEASRLKSEFLATMSHEIRTPMNGVIGMAGLLMDTPLNPAQQEMGRVLLTSAENLLTIIDDILDFSKMEAGKFRIVANEFELQAVVDETVALLAPRAQEKRLELTREFDPELASPVVGDAGRVRQVLMNLVGNAIKFTDRGEVRISVTLVARREGHVRFRVTVNDTGVGIPPEAQSRLFQPFTQVDGTSTRRFGGTGLGLAICRQLLALMGGTIGFRSEPRKGSTFWFELELPQQPGAGRCARPLAGEADRVRGPAPVGDRRAEAEPAARASGRALRVLLVEDNTSNQMVAQLLLQKLGHTADLAVNGEEALRALGRQTYDVVLMDCQMPVLDGFETTRRIRAGRLPGVNARVPVIALTAHAMTEDRLKCLSAGMDGYLTKPLRERPLREALLRLGFPTAPAEESPAGDAPATVVRPVEPDVLDETVLATMRALPGRKGASLLPELIEIFLREQPGRMARLAALAAERDAIGLARGAHAIAGSCANLGATKMRHAALALEQAARQTTWAEVSTRLAELELAWAHVQTALAQRSAS